MSENCFVRLNSAGPMGSDCTAPYYVSFSKGITVEEFVNYILNDRGKEEWGRITVHVHNKDKQTILEKAANDLTNGIINIVKYHDIRREVLNSEYCQNVEYNRGHLLTPEEAQRKCSWSTARYNFDDDILQMTVETASAHGGWTAMDYELHVLA